MDQQQIGKHISHKFNEEIEDVRNQFLVMGGLVEQQLADAVDALVTGNLELAEKVIQGDADVNNLEHDIDSACLLIIARRQPTAFDLRLLIAISKAISELERVGDQAKRIADMAIKLEEFNKGYTDFHELKHLLELVRSILTDALDVFARLDVNSAVEVVLRDKEVDQEYISIFRQLTLSMMEDSRNIKRTLNVMNVIRSLERISDHAGNVCDYVIYAVQGQDVRHVSGDKIKATVLGHRT